MQEIIISIMESFGYLGILLLITIENVFPPIPSEVILLFAGFMTTKSKLTLVGVIIVSTIGSLIGAIILYLVGRLLNKERLIKIINGKIGKILRLSEKDILKADEWFSKKGTKTVFFCRFVPVLRSLISIPAGISGMNIPKFLIYTTIGSLIWNAVLSYMGMVTGENWEKILAVFETYSTVIKIILLIGVVVLIYIFYRKKQKTKA